MNHITHSQNISISLTLDSKVTMLGSVQWSVSISVQTVSTYVRSLVILTRLKRTVEWKFIYSIYR